METPNKTLIIALLLIPLHTSTKLLIIKVFLVNFCRKHMTRRNYAVTLQMGYGVARMLMKEPIVLMNHGNDEFKVAVSTHLTEEDTKNLMGVVAQHYKKMDGNSSTTKKYHWCEAIPIDNEICYDLWASCDPNAKLCDGGRN
jgi:hypothetical protein